MKTPIMLIGLLISLLILSGCYSVSLVASYDSDRLVPQKTTQWCFAWGIVKPKDKQAGCGNENVANITIKTNFMYKTIAFLSAGIVVPIQMEWHCSPPEEEIELLGEGGG